MYVSGKAATLRDLLLGFPLVEKPTDGNNPETWSKFREVAIRVSFALGVTDLAGESGLSPVIPMDERDEVSIFTN